MKLLLTFLIAFNITACTLSISAKTEETAESKTTEKTVEVTK